MPYVRSCRHCNRLYTSEAEATTECGDREVCSACREAYDQLLADCQFRLSGALSTHPLRQSVRRLKQRIRPFPPSNLREAILWLIGNPRVRITGPTPESTVIETREEAFIRFEDGLLWFRGSSGNSQVPVGCIRTADAARAETKLQFDGTGFTIEKFGAQIRVEYLL
jgi:hypothetical protein